MGERVAELLLTTEGEFRGKPPEIPLPADINMEELTGGADPFFVTLPIMEIGAKSRNKTRTASGKAVNRVYGKDSAERLVDSINRNRNGGVQGHPKFGERSTMTSSAHWVAAVIEGDTAWGKAFIPADKEGLRNELRAKMALNSKIATSLYGSIDGVQESGEVVGLDVNYVDIVDPYEAGVGALAARPMVTTEQVEEENEDDMGETIQELINRQVEDREQIAELKQQIGEKTTRINELEADAAFAGQIRELFEGADNKAIVTGIRQMRQDIEEIGRRAVVAEVAQLVDGMEQFKIKAAREMVLEMLGVRTTDDGKQIVAETFPGSVEQAKEQIEAWLAKSWVQQTLKAIAVAEMGPGAIVGAKANGQHGNNLEDTPEARREARRQAGF